MTINHAVPDAASIDSIGYICTDSADPADMHSRFEDLETVLLDISGTHILQLRIMCRQQTIAKNVLKLLLDGAIFSRYFGQLRKVSVWIDKASQPWRELSSNKILSTLMHFTVEGTTTLLDTAQHVEVLLHNECNGQKGRYLRGLLDTGTSALSSSDQPSLQDKDVQGTSSVRVEDTMECEEQRDKGGAPDGLTQLGRMRHDLGNLREPGR